MTIFYNEGEATYMVDEILDIFSIDMKQVGTATRNDVHRKGYWHQTFHCWFIEEDTKSILFQRRHKNKKDYPNTLDITVAGHLSAGEGPEDGVREISEEVGIDVQMDELIPSEIYQGSIVTEDIIDNEFCHLFFYNNVYPLDTFSLQKDEVESIVRIPLDRLRALMDDEIHELQVNEYHIDIGRSTVQPITVTKADFVPHEERYYQHIISKVHTIFYSHSIG